MTNISSGYESNLDLNLLRVFAVVAEEGSVTRAATRLYVTQPAVSAALRRLATFVGAELVTRQGRGVVLTNRGKELATVARAHLPALVAATRSPPAFDPATSTVTFRLGLADPLEAILLPRLMTRLRREAPLVQIITLPVQFRTVEAELLDCKVDMAVSVADDLPRSIIRRPLVPSSRPEGVLVCLFDPRHTKLPRGLTEREYFAREHVAVSYAADVRGIVEDALDKTRIVRVSVPSFGHVVDLIDGSPLLATVPALLAAHIVRTRPYLRHAPLPFTLPAVSLDLLWLRASDDDAASAYLRRLLLEVGRSIAGTRRRDKGTF